MGIDEQLRELHGDLGWKQLSSGWAKAEIAIGLLAASIGLLLIVRAAADSLLAIDWTGSVAGIGLFTLGGYLAAAGHRSHLYQSNNQLAAWLARKIRGIPEQHEPRT